MNASSTAGIVGKKTRKTVEAGNVEIIFLFFKVLGEQIESDIASTAQSLLKGEDSTLLEKYIVHDDVSLWKTSSLTILHIIKPTYTSLDIINM